jgi:hypothetical protein
MIRPKNPPSLQAQGHVVEAQKRMIEAHDLLDKAIQFQGQANALFGTASKINGNSGLYDLAAGIASKHGAFQAGAKV